MKAAMVLALVVLGIVGSAAMAVASEQPEGPWGDEPWESWCMGQIEQGIYPPECSAQWHPETHLEQHESEVELIPPKTEVKGHQPIAMSTIKHEPKIPLAATGVSLGVLTALSVALVASGGLILAYVSRRRIPLKALLKPYGVRGAR